MTDYVRPIESETLKNTYFRQVLFTGKHAQLVVMCLQPGEEIGEEVHPKLYTIYSPPNHPDGTVHETKSEAGAAEAAEHHPLNVPRLERRAR